MKKWRGGLAWVPLLTGGGVWGLGAARTLAHELHSAFWFGVSGAVSGFLLGALVAALAGLALRRNGHDLRLVSLRAAPLYLPLIDILGSGHVAWRGPVLLVGALLVTVLGSARVPSWVWLVLSILLPFAVYLPDVSPYVGRADTFEFQVIGPQLGIAHPSGYPLYTLICKLFSFLPLGSIAWRINLTSVVFASLASGLLYLTLAKRTRPLALLTALMLAFSPVLWSRAIEAEVYALNAFLTAAVLWVVVAWTDDTLKPRWAWPALGLLMGLALASHITLGALGGIALGGLLAARQKPQRRIWLLAAGLGCLGLLLYAYIPLRWPAVTGGERLSPAEFVRFVTNAGSGGALRPMAFLRDPGRWLVVGRLLLAQVGWVGLALAGIGLVALGRDRGRSEPGGLAPGTLAAFGAWVWFNLSFYVAEPDYSAFLIPAFVVLVFWMGRGMQWVWEIGKSAAGQGAPVASLSGILWVTLIAGLCLSRIWRTGPGLDTISVGQADELWARYVLALPLEDGAAILADSEKFPPLYYLQKTGNVRPDLELVTLFSEPQYRDALDRRLAAGQAVYLARYLPGVDGYGVSSTGPLVAVAPAALSHTPAEAGVRFGEDLGLAAYQLEADPLGRAMHHLTLTWRVDDVVEDDLDVWLRLVDPDSETPIWEINEGRPVGGYTTTRAWQVGWVSDDYHALGWPEWVPDGIYRLDLRLSPHFEVEGLPVGDGSRTWYALGEVILPIEATDLASRARVGSGGADRNRTTALLGSKLWLVGAQFPGEASAGAPVELDLTWVCGGNDSEELVDGVRLELLWVPEDGKGEVQSSPLVARGEGGATIACRGGADAIARRYPVEVPASPGRYRLEVGWPEGTSEPQTSSARCRWLGPSRRACAIGVVTVTAAMAGDASFDGRILLASSSFDAESVPAGGPMQVALTWRAVQALDEDYTVFVQVLGPDGQLYGQVDSWPGQGVRPTSGWAPGEEIADAYEFYIDGDRPDGEYRVIVGWYLLADMSRLPVLDSTGYATGDFVEIGAFTLP